MEEGKLLRVSFALPVSQDADKILLITAKNIMLFIDEKLKTQPAN